MSHRTQITLEDAQYARLLQESERTGLSLAELVRRALNAAFGNSGNEGVLTALEESFGAWRGRQLDGAAFVDAMRHGLNDVEPAGNVGKSAGVCAD